MWADTAFGRAAAYPAPSPSPTATAKPLSQDKINDFIQRVQIALIMKGYDPGPVNGELSSPKTQAALRAFQSANSLSASGFLDTDTLVRLGVSP